MKVIEVLEKVYNESTIAIRDEFEGCVEVIAYGLKGIEDESEYELNKRLLSEEVLCAEVTNFGKGYVVADIFPKHRLEQEEILKQMEIKETEE